MPTPAQIGVTGLAVMGRNLARNLARNGYAVALHNRTAGAHQSPGRGARRRGHVRADRDAGGLRRGAGAAAPRRDHGEGGRAHRRGDRRAGAAARRRATSSSTAATRTSPTPAAARPTLRERGLHFVGAGVSGGEEGALLGPSIMPGGSTESYDDARPDVREDRRAGRRHAVLHARRPGRRRPLREDGAQRHRVRRHAADRRGVRPAARRARRARRPRSRRSSPSGTPATWSRS